MPSVTRLSSSQSEPQAVPATVSQSQQHRLGDLPPPVQARRAAAPQRLAVYTPPDFQAVAIEVADGASLKSIWRRYAATATAPIGYVAFTMRFREWKGVTRPRSATAAGVPDYLPAEDSIADTYWADKSDPRSSVLVLAGFGCSLKVEHGLLATFDTGVSRKFEPTNHRLSAVVFTGSGGIVTIDAIKWCTTQNIGILVLDWHSVTLPNISNDVNIRRAQFAADPLPIAQAVLHQKLLASFRIGRLSEWTFRSACSQINAARLVESLLIIEANAAIDYWGHWAFPVRHRPRGWPPSWVEFNNRGSPISRSPRHATHPVNAILNYAYGIAAGMCVGSLISIGLDASAAFLHSDQDGRYSLAYDLLELLRPEVDGAILPWVASQRWSRADFPVTRSGIVRLQPALARVVVERTVAAVPFARVEQAAEWLRGVIESQPRAEHHDKRLRDKPRRGNVSPAA